MYCQWQQAAPDDCVLVDLPGNIGDAVDSERIRSGRVVEALGRTVILVWVASEEEDSIWLFEPARFLAAPAATLFVMNGRYGANVTRFASWQESKSRARFISDGGQETLLPALPIYPRTAIVRARSTFHDLTAANLTLVEQIDFAMWWEQVEHALQPFARMMENAWWMTASNR